MNCAKSCQIKSENEDAAALYQRMKFSLQLIELKWCHDLFPQMYKNPLNGSFTGPAAYCLCGLKYPGRDPSSSLGSILTLRDRHVAQLLGTLIDKFIWHSYQRHPSENTTQVISSCQRWRPCRDVTSGAAACSIPLSAKAVGSRCRLRCGHFHANF